MAAQKRSFPKLRKAWAEQSANKLWEHDIEVQALGSRSDIIAFTGGMFAANANIKRCTTSFAMCLKIFASGKAGSHGLTRLDRVE